MTVPSAFLAFLEEQRRRVSRQCVQGRPTRERWRRRRDADEQADWILAHTSARYVQTVAFEARNRVRIGAGREGGRDH